MEWLRISTSTELVRVATDEIVYVRADGNYSDLMLTNGNSRKMTFQLHFFDEVFQEPYGLYPSSIKNLDGIL